MHPALLPLTLVSGDTFDIDVALYTLGADAAGPLEVGNTEAFVLTLQWPGGRIVAATDDTGPGRLLITRTASRFGLSRQLLPVETARLPLGTGTIWSLVRVPARGERRTYATGPVNALGPGQTGPDAAQFGLTAEGRGITVAFGVPDAASYTDGQVAVLRAEMAAAIQAAEEDAAAFALFF